MCGALLLEMLHYQRNQLKSEIITLPDEPTEENRTHICHRISSCSRMGYEEGMGCGHQTPDIILSHLNNPGMVENSLN